MLGDWRSYRLEDFIPFTPEVYFRLIERINEAFWPAHLIAAAFGLAALVLALRGNLRVALILLAPAWLASAIVFHFHYYAEIHVAAGHFGWAFIAQAAVLVLIAALTRKPPRPGRAAATIGVLLAMAGLIVYPFVAALAGHGWSQSETFALHPDPTAIATLGIVLISLRGWAAWLALFIPALWCIATSLTLIALGAGWAALPLAAAIVAGIALAATPLAGRRSG